MTIEEIMARMAEIVALSADRPLTDDEATEYEALETNLQQARRTEQIQARNAAYNAVPARVPGAPAGAGAAVVNEQQRSPYNMRLVTNRITGTSEFVFSNAQEHNFSADLHQMFRNRDEFGQNTDGGRRVMAALEAVFRPMNDVDTADTNETVPTINRPDLYVDQRDYRTPLTDLVGRGAPPNGVQPFSFPKYSSASGLVGAHTEGTEPTSGTFVTTNQTVQPTAISGKASITREVWDMGGNPSVAGLIWNQMVRGYRERREQGIATFLNTLTAAADITLAAGSADETLAAAYEAAIADLQFIRGYNFEAFVLEKELYKKFAAARDTAERPLYPILNPSNANGTAAARFRTLDLAGVTGVPSWALASTAGSPNNSWLFDPAVIFAWATAPQRLEFPGSTQAGAYAPVAFIDLAIWGYEAYANTDIGGVRQVIYDTTA